MRRTDPFERQENLDHRDFPYERWGAFLIGEVPSRGKVPGRMATRSGSPREVEKSTVRIVVLHDDHLTAARGTLLARSIADEMGHGTERETKLWNVHLLDTPFATLAETDTTNADLLLIALRTPGHFDVHLKLWLRRWLVHTRHTSAAMLVVLENDDTMAMREMKEFIERAAHSEGKDYFNEPADLSTITTTAGLHEFLWVL